MSAAPVCPFCKGVIPADLARFGGNCPHCLLEVPGEDAPTDPGAILRAKQAEEERKAAAARQRARQRTILVAAVAFVGLVGAGGWWAWSQQQAAVYELDDYYVLPLDALATAPTPAAPVEPTPTPTGRPGKKPAAGGSAGASGSTGANPTAGGTATPPGTGAPSRPTSGTSSPSDAVPAEVAALMGGGSGATGSVSLGGGAAIDVSRPDLVLSDEAEIVEMAKQVIARSSPQLQNCYQQRLKQVPDLAGAWKVQFDVTRAGGIDGIEVDGLDRDDRELEACIARNLAGWKFMKIAREQTFSKTYRFRPAGG